MTSNRSTVSVHGLTKRYGPRTVVDSLDLDLPPGVVAGFVGPNGAGKTTTMAMLLGLVRPDAGTGTVLGEPIGHPAAYLSRVGAMVETPAFYPALTGRENLAMFATMGRQPHDRIPIVLDLVGLGARAGDRYRAYSLGMKQRLGIAAALLGDPALLILDEPANGLDPQGVREMRDLVGSLAHSGRTVLVSSHDLSELEQVCDWLVLIDAGRVRYQGPAEQFLGATGREIVAVPEHATDLGALTRAVDEVFSKAAARTGATAAGPRPADRPTATTVVDPGSGALRVSSTDLDGHGLAAVVNRAAHAAGITLVELRPHRVSLEDRYLALLEGASR